MPIDTRTPDPQLAEDLKVLHGMGYAQELARSMKGFQNFAISFSIICILSGGINSLGPRAAGLRHGLRPHQGHHRAHAGQGPDAAGGAVLGADLYPHEWAEQAAAALPSLRYVPVLSEPRPEDGWFGRTGLVHQAVMEDLADLSGHQVYACGVPIMVESARRDFVARCGLPAEEFYADSFTSEADKHGGVVAGALRRRRIRQLACTMHGAITSTPRRNGALPIRRLRQPACQPLPGRLLGALAHPARQP
jgi:hypothetical protein